jgi:hypothetical protein
MDNGAINLKLNVMWKSAGCPFMKKSMKAIYLLPQPGTTVAVHDDY